MPKIDLHGDMRDRYWVRAVELFPTDLHSAQRFFAVECLKAEIEGDADDVKHEVNTLTLRLLLDAPSYAALKEAVIANTKQALVAGDVLGALYLMHKFNVPEPSINKAIDVAMRYARRAKYGDGTSLAISEPTIRKYWESYKTVAHFWAARRLGQAYPFADRNSPQWFDTYLQVAQGIFEFGTSFIPQRARPPLTILSREDCWALPEKIEARHLTTERLPDVLLKSLKKYKSLKNRA